MACARKVLTINDLPTKESVSSASFSTSHSDSPMYSYGRPAEDTSTAVCTAIESVALGRYPGSCIDGISTCSIQHQIWSLDAPNNSMPPSPPALGHSPVRWGIPRLDGLFPGSGAQMGHAGVKFPLILTILEKSLPCRLSLSKHFQNLVTVECRTFQFVYV